MILRVLTLASEGFIDRDSNSEPLSTSCNNWMYFLWFNVDDKISGLCKFDGDDIYTSGVIYLCKSQMKLLSCDNDVLRDQKYVRSSDWSRYDVWGDIDNNIIPLVR